MTLSKSEKILVRATLAALEMDCAFPTDGGRRRNREAYESAIEYLVPKIRGLLEPAHFDALRALDRRPEFVFDQDKLVALGLVQLRPMLGDGKPLITRLGRKMLEAS